MYFSRSMLAIVNIQFVHNVNTVEKLMLRFIL